VGLCSRIDGTVHTLTRSGVWLVTRPHRAPLRRIKEISSVINILMNCGCGEGVLQKEVLCSVAESVPVVDLRISCRHSMKVKLTTHVGLRTVPRSRMRDAVPPLTIRVHSVALIMNKDHLHMLW
jgi:hypothetical protein